MSKGEWSTKLENDLIQEIDNYIELRYGSISKGNRKRFLLEAYVKMSGAEIQVENDDGELVTVTQQSIKPASAEAYELVEKKVNGIMAFNKGQKEPEKRLLINGALLDLLFNKAHQKPRRDYLKANAKEIAQHHADMGLGNANKSHNTMNLLKVDKGLSSSATALLKAQLIKDLNSKIDAVHT